jgi:SPP1 family phage portal protein
MKLEDLKVLLTSKDVDSLKTQFNALEETSDLNKSTYYIKNHDVMDPVKRPDKQIKGDDGTSAVVRVGRLPLPYQKKIVTIASAFLGVPKVNSTPNNPLEKDFVKVIDKVLDDNKIDYKFRTCVKNCKSEKSSAILIYTEELPEKSEYWEGFPINSRFRLRLMILSPSLGDELLPLFDSNGDMIAFARSYEINERVDGKELTTLHFDIYTADEIIYTQKETNGTWLWKSFPNLIKKIPVIYFSQPHYEWDDVESLISRLEFKSSNHADTNDYYDSPIVKAKGQVQGFAAKGEAGKILQMDKEADVEYLTYDNLPESMKMEIDNLERWVHQFTHTPDISFESMKGLGTYSGFALKMMFMDAHMKASDSEEIFGEGAQRLFNYLKAAIAVLDPKYKPALKLQIKPQFTYFLPKNTEEEAKVVGTAYKDGIISLETAVKLNPLVEDYESELELIKKEKESKTTTPAPPIVDPNNPNPSNTLPQQ